MWFHKSPTAYHTIHTVYQVSHTRSQVFEWRIGTYHAIYKDTHFEILNIIKLQQIYISISKDNLAFIYREFAIFGVSIWTGGEIPNRLVEKPQYRYLNIIKHTITEQWLV